MSNELERAQRELARRQAVQQAKAELEARQAQIQQNGADIASRAGALGRGVVSGATLGFGDNIGGAGAALLGRTRNDDGSQNYFDYSGSMGDRYTAERDYDREQDNAAKDAHPSQFIGGQIGGAMLPAIATSPLAMGGTTGAAATTGQRILNSATVRGAGLGMVEGGLQGAGNADGQDVTKNAIKGALIGGGVGAAAPAVVGAAGAVKNAIKDPVTGVIDSMIGRANTGKANRAISQALQSSGQSADDVGQAVMKAAQQGQPEFRMMDALGTAGQRQASGVTRAGGDAATEMSDFLTSRQAGQADRVGGFVDDAFGTTGTTAAKTTDALTQARSTAANTAYDAARGNAAPVDIRGALGVIDDRIGGMQGSGVAGDSIDGKLAGYRSRLAAQSGPDGVSRELSDFDRVLGVKQSIQDDIGAAVRAGRNNEARELGRLAQELDGALEGSSDMYRAANDGFREASRTIDAVDQGAMMSRRGRAADNVPAFQGMNPDQQGAARIGYGDDLLRRIEANTAPTANKAKILQSPKRDAEAGAMAVDPKLYGDRLGRENTMWETQNRALGGSKTADNLQDISQAGDLASGALGVARSGANLQLGDAVAKIGGMLGPIAKGQNEATRQLIARALMSDDPVKALAPVLRQDMTSKSTRRAIEAMLRQPMREAGVALSQ